MVPPEFAEREKSHVSPLENIQTMMEPKTRCWDADVKITLVSCKNFP